ncbi:hypothetical protein MesoLj113b_54820 [Mesorhizobium sp. 113-3-3]|nr:hypothetical protein MesoLj113b_54820 [Mesorhizobium sp. 113-3-3]
MLTAIIPLISIPGFLYLRAEDSVLVSGRAKGSRKSLLGRAGAVRTPTGTPHVALPTAASSPISSSEMSSNEA